MVLLGLLLFLTIWKRHWIQAVETALLMGIQIVLWLYLLYKGRVPARAIYSMNLLLWSIAIVDMERILFVP